MNNRYKYRHYLDHVQFDPIMPKSTAKVWEREDKRVFHRESLKGDLMALRGDFEKFNSAAIDHEFGYNLERNVNGTYVEIAEGKLHKTDATNIDQDRKIWKTQVRSIDRYEKLLAAYDKEFDLVRELEPPTYVVNYVKLPLIQVAFDTHTNLFNLIGDSVYLKEIAPYIGPELEDFGFKAIDLEQGYIPGSADMTVDVSGLYDDLGGGVFYVREDGNFRVMMEDVGGGNVQWVIRGWGANVGLGAVYRIDEVAPTTVNMFETDADRTMFGSKVFQSETTDSTCKFFLRKAFIRILTDKETVLGDATIELPAAEDDIGGHDFGYSRYVDGDANDNILDFVVLPTDGHQTTPNQWGKFQDDALHFAGEYFVPLSTGFLDGFRKYPVCKIGWREYSMWGFIFPDLQEILDDAAVNKVLRDAYRLQDALKYLLFHIDPTIVFDANSTHSRFFNDSTNPLTGDLNAFTHFITPKSNIVFGDYDNPATRGIIKFSDIDQLLSNALDCHWWIDNNGLFHIEHIKYYKNGRSYNTPIVASDLTVQLDPRLNKEWSYLTENYRYKKEIMPEQMTFGWMDKTSDPFDGYPIDMLSQGVQIGNKDDKRISSFTSDIDYGQAFPENMSKDGFYIMAAGLVGDDWHVQMEELAISGLDTITLQNGFWSMWHLHDKFHRHNMPCVNIRLNNQETTATTVKRTKEQEIIIASPIEPDHMRLARTSIGVVEIVAMEVNLETRANKLIVLGDTD
jgi:hypothetical protein